VSSDLQNDSAAWLSTFTPTHLHELEQAAAAYLAKKRDIAHVTKADFVLPSLSLHLQQLREKLLYGNGVEVLRGLPVNQYSFETTACMFMGIGSHLGNARKQNAAGDLLGHVRDLGKSSDNPNARIYQTAERQTFHTDSADVVGLLCLQQAKQGGESLLVSALSLFNRYQALRPDLLPLLFEPIATDRRGEVATGQKPFVLIPVFNWFANELTVFYQRQYIDSAQRFPDAPRLTPQHIEALDLFDTLANDPSLHFSMQLIPGDLQFVYNHSQLHDRTAFEDWPDRADRRHLLRLWLSLEGDRPLPICFKERYGSIEVGNRGGVNS